MEPASESTLVYAILGAVCVALSLAGLTLWMRSPRRGTLRRFLSYPLALGGLSVLVRGLGGFDSFRSFVFVFSPVLVVSVALFFSGLYSFLETPRDK